MRVFHAIDLRWPSPPGEAHVERVLAELDDMHPTAVEETASGVRVFFSNVAERARAHAIVSLVDPAAAAQLVDVPDEQWAERSQTMLTPVRVGRFVITPPWHGAPADPDTLALIVQPSMGFGTGHHPSTRLCLRLLQGAPVTSRSVLDVGTGSGVLAMAAARLGAAPVVAVDVDPDALDSARENLLLNHLEDAVSLRLLDVHADSAGLGRTFDIVLANLTGAMLQREAAALARLVAPGGSLIASGFQSDEGDAVTEGFGVVGLVIAERADEDSWVAVRLESTRASQG